MAKRWNPADHPRYGNGRFRPKFSQSVRLSPISVSYNAGARVPIVPGRANLYIGALVRVESAQGGKILKRQTDRLIDSVARRFGDAKGTSHLAQVFKGNSVNVRGLNVQGPSRIIKPPTFRVSSTPASRASATIRPVPRTRRTRVRAVATAPSPIQSVRTHIPVARGGIIASASDLSGVKARRPRRSRKASRRR